MLGPNIPAAYAKPSVRRRLVGLAGATALALGALTTGAAALPVDLPILPPLGPVLIDTHNFGNTALLPGSLSAGFADNIQFAATGQPCRYREQFGFGSGFSCAFANVPDPHFVRYQQQIFNPSLDVVSFPVGFFFPDGGSPILGTLTLGASSSFVIGINANDNFDDFGLQYLWNVNATPFNLRTSAVLVEDSSNLNVPGSFNFVFFSDPLNDSFVVDNSVTPLFRWNDPGDFAFAVPEPETLLLLALGLAGAARLRQRQPRG